MAETKKYLTMKERICFTVGAFGRSGIYTLMSMFTLVFFQNGAGLTLKQGTTIILIGRIFDALNDPVMGMIVDRTKSKWGKMRPYLLFAPIPIAITTIALFSAPFKEGSTAAFIWALVTYILWGVAFTIQDVPFWGLSSVITPLESERTSFISTARLGSTFGGILPALLVPILYQSNMGYTKGFFLSGVIFALLGCGLSILIFFVSKERVPKMDHTPSFKETFVVLGKNKLLIIVIFAAILGSTMVTANQCADYIGNYIIIQNYTDFTQIFQDFLPGAQTTLIPNVDAAAAYDFWIPRGTIVTTLTVAIGVGMVPAMAIFPMLRKKLSLKQIYIGSAIFGLVVHALCYVVMAHDVTKANIYVLWIFLFLMGLPLGIYNVITYALIADSVDYLEWKTGERQEGVCFAFQTFLSKVNAAVATFVFGQILDRTDFKAVDKSLVDTAGRQIFFEQSVNTQKMLLALVTIVPAIGFLLTIIPMFFNNYTGKVKEQLKSNYRSVLKEYNRCLAQRNMLLKDMKNNANLEDMLYIWDKNLAKSGAKIIYQREKYIEALLPFATEIFDGLSKGREKIDLKLQCGFECKDKSVAEIENELTKLLISGRNSDILNRITTSGPHRDDMEILINEKSARLYASQGQQRSCVLALKLAEASLLKEMTDDEPLALLDDVMSELDESRQDYILNHIKNWQVFITCCDANTVLRLKKGKTFHIENGRCKN